MAGSVVVVVVVTDDELGELVDTFVVSVGRLEVLASVSKV